MVFQVISKRFEKGSIILTSNKTFSKAHMFRRTGPEVLPEQHGFKTNRQTARPDVVCGL
ncbi:hypothetical protein SVIRM249S_00497 [Streptomyces viridochromogenes]